MGKASRRKEQLAGRASVSTTAASPRQSFITRPLLILILLSLPAALIYSNTFSASFHFDDNQNIVENPWIKDLSNLSDLSGTRYIGFLSFALNYYFGGLNVFGYHLVNLLIHITNGFLVYTLVLLLFKTLGYNTTTNDPRFDTAPWVALATALLFEVHPIQTQAVTYIVQRFASLALLFYLLTVVCYLKWRLAPSEEKSNHLWYGTALLSTILAMKTKENTFTLPFMLLLIEAVFFAPLTRKAWIGLIPFLLTLPIIPLSRPGALGEGEAGLARETLDISRWDYLFTQFRVIMTYLRLLVFPVNQNLDYDYPVHHSFLEPSVFLSFLGISFLFALSAYLLVNPGPKTQHSKLISFGILWFFLTLSIESSVIPIRDVIFEHRMYLPGMGWSLAMSLALLYGLEGLKRWGMFKKRSHLTATYCVIAAVVVLSLSLASYLRNQIWKDDLTLWTDVVVKSPKKGRAFNALGVYHDRNGTAQEALQAYLTALKFNPDSFQSHNNLGNLYRKQGQIEDAIREYKAALKLKNNFVDAHTNLGILYADQGRLEEAIGEYQASLRFNPQSADTHNALGDAYRLQGRISESFQEFQMALRLDPDFSEAYNNLGLAYQAQGKVNEAHQAFEKALALSPKKPDTLINLGRTYADQGEWTRALSVFQNILKDAPNYDKAYFEIGNLYFNQGQREEAAQFYRKALQLQPDNADYHNNLGSAYFNMGQSDEAIREYQTALKIKPDNVAVIYNLGVAYERAGRFKEARMMFEQAFKINPNNKAVREALESLPK